MCLLQNLFTPERGIQTVPLAFSSFGLVLERLLDSFAFLRDWRVTSLVFVFSFVFSLVQLVFLLQFALLDDADRTLGCDTPSRPSC